MRLLKSETVQIQTEAVGWVVIFYKSELKKKNIQHFAKFRRHRKRCSRLLLLLCLDRIVIRAVGCRNGRSRFKPQW